MSWPGGGQDLVEGVLEAERLAGLDLDVAGLAGEVPESWWIMMRALGTAKRLPFCPAERSTAAMLAACPRQMVETGGFTYCMVS